MSNHTTLYHTLGKTAGSNTCMDPHLERAINAVLALLLRGSIREFAGGLVMTACDIGRFDGCWRWLTKGSARTNTYMDPHLIEQFPRFSHCCVWIIFPTFYFIGTMSGTVDFRPGT